MSGESTRASSPRAIVIDESAIVRCGLVKSLEDLGVTVMDVGDHNAALSGTVHLGSADLLIVGGADRSRVGDQFPGASIISTFRREQQSVTRRVIAVSPHATNPRFRRRLWEAGTDHVLDLSEIRSRDDFEQFVCGAPSSHRLNQMEPLWNEPSLGIDRDSRINSFVETANELGTHFLIAGSPEEMPSARSRWWLHFRRDLTVAGRLRVVNRDGSVPDRNQTICSVSQLRRVFEWSTKISPLLD